MKIEIWSDIACPWCYIGFHRFNAALEAFPHRDGVEVIWRAFELSPDSPRGAAIPEVEALAKSKGLSQSQVKEMFAHVASTGAELGLTLDFDTTVTANTFDAHRLVHIAAEQSLELADRVHEALWSAHFAQGKVIDDVNVLVEIAGSVGMDADAVRTALESTTAADAVRNDEAQARRLGISGVPFFVLNGTYGISGAQPTEFFAGALEEVWSKSHPLEVLTPVGGATTDGEACGPDGCAI